MVKLEMLAEDARDLALAAEAGARHVYVDHERVRRMVTALRAKADKQEAS